MTIVQINHEVSEAGQLGSKQYVEKFLTLEPQLLEQISSFDGLQTELYLHRNETEIEKVKFAAVFSDLLSIYMSTSSTDKTTLVGYEEGSPFYKQRQFTVPNSLSHLINPQQQQIFPYHIHHSDSDIKQEINLYKPLLNCGKSILRPIRALAVNDGLSGEKTGSLYYADGNTPDEHWYIKDNSSRESLPIEHYLSGDRAKILFELTLPYFKTTDLEKLVHVLDEESDLLSPFRKSLKDIILKFNEKETDLIEIRNDILQPQVDNINRRFRNFRNRQASKFAGGIGLFGLSLVQVHIPWEHIAAFLTLLVSGTGVNNTMASYREYQDKLNTLRDEPFFLLWRIKRLPRLWS